MLAQVDATLAPAYIQKDLSSPAPPWYIQFEVRLPAAFFSAWGSNSNDLVEFADGGEGIFIHDPSGTPQWWTEVSIGGPWGAVAPDTLYTVLYSYVDDTNVSFAVDGVTLDTFAVFSGPVNLDHILVGDQFGGIPGDFYCVGDVRVGSTPGGTEHFGDDFSSGNFFAWDTVVGSMSIGSDCVGPPTPVPPTHICS